MFRLRWPIIVLAALSGPVMLISYGWMLKQLVLTAPGWLTAICVTAHLAAWLGIASLLDMRAQQDRW